MKNFISLFFMLFFLSHPVWALEDSQLSHIKVFDSEGDSAKISIYPYHNQEGTLEVRIDAAGITKYLNSFNPTIGYGRDLDGNGKIDTWFFITKKGIETVQREGNDSFGRDILGELVLSKYSTSPFLYLSTGTTTLLSYLFLTASEIKTEKQNFYLDWINLEELSLRLDQEIQNPSTTLSKEQIEAQKKLIAFGYSQLSGKLDFMIHKNIYEYAAVDAVLWFSGGILLKGAAKLLAIPLKALSETAIAKYISENTIVFLKGQQEVLSKKFSRFSPKASLLKAEELAAEAGFKLTAFTWRRQVGLSVRAYIAKKKLLSFAKGVFKGAQSEWKYIGLNIGIQSVAESITHYDDIKDPDPTVMADKLFSNEAVQQDIGFMTLDTVLMTGLSRNFKTTKARFMACGLIALNDSSAINFVIKKDDDYKRIALDTTWEVMIGNAQVQADLAALSYFEKMALKNRNPKIKLLGYAFAIIDQTIGYIGYSKAAEKVGHSQPSPAQTPILVPLLTQEE